VSLVKNTVLEPQCAQSSYPEHESTKIVFLVETSLSNRNAHKAVTQSMFHFCDLFTSNSTYKVLCSSTNCTLFGLHGGSVTSLVLFPMNSSVRTHDVLSLGLGFLRRFQLALPNSTFIILECSTH